MRIDLEHGVRRPWHLRLLLWVLRRVAGMVPGPILTITYRPAFFDLRFLGYLQGAMRRSPVWSKGEAELIASFVSDRNRCHF